MRIIFISSICCVFFTATDILSVQIEPTLRVFQQPDGREFIGRILGDEYVVFYETAEGYTILRNGSNVWTYARVGSDGRLSPSEFSVGKANPEQVVGQKHLRHGPAVMSEIQNERNTFYERFRLLKPSKLIEARNELAQPSENFTPVTYNLAVLLIEFPDVESAYSPEDFHNLIFSENFAFVSPAPEEPSFGSVNDYYQKMSNGSLRIIGEVFDWVPADNEKGFYEEQGNISAEAVTKSGVNLNEFDGYTVIYAGDVGKSSGNLWPQTLIAGGKLHYLMSEKWLPKYDFSPIGVHCHEFGHLLGLPDLYDTDFSSVGVGNWCTMGTGNFGGGHHERPFNMCAWSKVTLGWTSTQNLYDGHHTDLILRPIESDNEAYKVISFASYFLLENRQRLDYDLNLPGVGLLIWHIDERFGGQPVDEHRLVDLEEADGTETTGDDGDPFPGKSDNLFFGAATTPSSEDYDGQSYMELSNISLTSSNISFDVDIELGSGLGITVNDQGNFSNLFTAIEAAFPNGVVFVPSGHYFESNLQLKNGVVINGENATSTIVDGEGKRLFEMRNLQHAEINHLTLTNGATGVGILNSDVDIKHCIISRMSVNGILCFKTEANIQNNTIVNVNSSGIACLSDAFPNIKNNILSFNGVGIAKISAASPVLSYNDVWNNGLDYQALDPGVTDISLNPLFVNPFLDDYHLLPESPCINAGDPDSAFNDPDGTRNDIGALPFEFKQFIVGEGIRINSGGLFYEGESDSTLWSQDQPYVEGNWGFVGGTTESTSDEIKQTDRDPIYQAARRGLSAYRVDVPNGFYDVILHFAEIVSERPAERMFDVAIEDSVMLTDYDIFAQVGHDHATQRKFQVRVNDAQLNIDFITKIGEPLVSAIEVLPIHPLFIDIADFGKVADPGFASGVALADYNGDDATDIFVANAFKTNSLFVNNGLGTFINRTRTAGLDNTEGSEGGIWGDYDNDGNLDLYIVRDSKPNLLYHNLGRGSFSELAAKARVDDAGPGKSAAWADFDNDGHLDLFVANTDADLLFRNKGDGTFEDVTTNAGLTENSGSTDGIWADFDNDGYLDLLVTHLDNTFSTPNSLYFNNQDGSFSLTHLGKNGLGATPGDYDNDGDLDVFVISLLSPLGSGEQILFRNNGDRTFTDVTEMAGLSANTIAQSAAWGDLNYDGWLDIYLSGNSDSGQLLQNNGDGTFTNISQTLGFDPDPMAKAAALADLDSDGDLDIYEAKEGVANSLLQNLSNENNWLIVKAVGGQSNRSGIGARIRLVVGSLVQIRDVEGSSGFRSQNSLPVEFGLGKTSVIDTLQVLWPSGVIDTFINFHDLNGIFEAQEGLPVPVELTSFDAMVQRDQVILEWKTTKEVNLFGYQVERKAHAERDFETIAFLSSDNAAEEYFSYKWVDTGLPLGEYSYRLKFVNLDGSFRYSDSIHVVINPPVTFELSQNYPNPAILQGAGSPITTFQYALPKTAEVSLKIYNIIGQEVVILQNEVQTPGFHSVQWNGFDKNGILVSSGVYFYLFESNNYVDCKKMIVVSNKFR